MIITPKELSWLGNDMWIVWIDDPDDPGNWIGQIVKGMERVNVTDSTSLSGASS